MAIAHGLFSLIRPSDFGFICAALIDPLLLLLMFIAILRSFGWRSMLVCALVFGANDFVMYGTNWSGATLRHINDMRDMMVGSVRAGLYEIVKIQTVVLLLILAFGAWFRLHYIEVPMADAHGWRQIFNADVARRTLLFFALVYRYYFRVETSGLENLPTGRMLVIPNHAGQIALLKKAG